MNSAKCNMHYLQIELTIHNKGVCKKFGYDDHTSIEKVRLEQI